MTRRSIAHLGLKLLRATPLHPQWLLGRRKVPPELLTCHGVVVDVGSADRWLQACLAPGAEYVALDLPAKEGRYAGRPDVFCRAEALPLADSSVDVVACFEVLEHVVDPAQAIAEAVRVLRPGGSYVLSMPFMYPLHDRPHDFRRYTLYGLHRCLTTAGLEVVAVRPMLHAMETVGLLAALAIAGGISRGGWRWLLLPLAAPAVLVINLIAWSGKLLWPNWDGITMGYEAVGRKP